MCQRTDIKIIGSVELQSLLLKVVKPVIKCVLGTKILKKHCIN
uniref:Uncharacterized protein n=1 Tax=Anguilla anguilla TaxID=7936 RepID=A0A0E9UG02_ANGAN